MTRTIAPLELVYVRDAPHRVGQLHHLAFWVDSREDVLRAADVFVDHGVAIEAGPALHTVGSSFFLYAVEPGGNRVGITTGADFVFDPDGPPRVWTATERRRGVGWGLQFPDTWKSYGTPHMNSTRCIGSPRLSHRLCVRPVERSLLARSGHGARRDPDR